MLDANLEPTSLAAQQDSGPITATSSPPPAAADPTDEALMRAFGEGELQAFEKLFARHARAVHDFFFYMTYSRDQAVRLSQEAWQAVNKHRSELAESGRFLPWLFGQAVQVRRERSPAAVADMAAAGNRSLPELPAVSLTAPGETSPGDARADVNADAAPVHRTLAAMADSYREVLVLHRLSGLSFADIAVALGATEAAVKARALQGYVQLAESGSGRASAGGGVDIGPPLPLSRCPETAKLINLAVDSPEPLRSEPLATLLRHTHDCPLCEVTHEQLKAGYGALAKVTALARPEPAALEQIARVVLPAVAEDSAGSGLGWALILAGVALLLIAITIAGLVLH